MNITSPAHAIPIICARAVAVTWKICAKWVRGDWAPGVSRFDSYTPHSTIPTAHSIHSPLPNPHCTHLHTLYCTSPIHTLHFTLRRPRCRLLHGVARYPGHPTHFDRSWHSLTLLQLSVCHTNGRKWRRGRTLCLLDISTCCSRERLSAGFFQ